MKSMHEGTIKTEQSHRKRYGLAGLVLSLTVLPTLGITALPALIVCFWGIAFTKRRKQSIWGLLITCFSLIGLFYAFVTVTPPGSIPYPLNIYKFKRACPLAVFWLAYKKESVIDVRSQNSFLFGCLGAIHYRGEPNEFRKQDVIEYAETNGWKCHLSLPLYKDDFSRYEDGLLKVETDASWEVLSYLYRSPILLKDDCEMLAFDSGNIHGDASFILISNNGSQMIIYYENPLRPDPANEFWLPYGFEDLREERIMTE